MLRHSKGEHAGKPFLLLPWQQEVFRNLFGVLNAEGRRQHRVSYIEVPKKMAPWPLRLNAVGAKEP